MSQPVANRPQIFLGLLRPKNTQGCRISSRYKPVIFDRQTYEAGGLNQRDSRRCNGERIHGGDRAIPWIEAASELSALEVAEDNHPAINQ